MLSVLCACSGHESGGPDDLGSSSVDVFDAVDQLEDEIGSDRGEEGTADDIGPGLDVDVHEMADSPPDQDDPAEDLVPDDSGDATTVLTLWTLNLLNPSNPLSPSGDVEMRTQMVIDAILEEQPDIIAFQEVVDSGTVPNRAELIAVETGYHWAWQKEYSLVIYDEGIAVLSRTPILETESIELPHVDLFLFTRYVLGARVETAAGPVDFYCTHMTVGGTEEQSADQAAAAWSFITERSAGIPAFFAGDLNAEPDTLSMRFLRGETSHGEATGDFIDAWLATRPGDLGYTIDSSDPHDRIDYIYVTATAPYPVRPRDCQLIFDEAADGIYASDHIGVACQIALDHSGESD